MRFLVSKSILAAIVITAGALTTHTAKAETTLKVPFSFTVAGQSMPAGVYSVSKDTIHDMVILKSMDASKTFSAVLVPGDPSPNDTHVALKFDQSGNGHTLKSIQYGARTTPSLEQGTRERGYDPTRLSQGR
jgi:hypothetical protein